ncbi:ATP-binding protein [Candidatus Saccharibacteria bacterium]|nr:ATP-binding protein [Candidatus Saccharibacteria bacterium]
MFQSATVKLTASYLAIIMAVSLSFSVVIYQLNYSEINSRLKDLQYSIVEEVPYFIPSDLTQPFFTGPNSPLIIQSQQAAAQMLLSLVYINLVILAAGGLGSYFLARRTLQPIEEAHEAQSRFTSDASHELRTPLAAMKAELEVSLRDAGLTIEEARELLESNLEEVNKLIQLSEMLLQLSRLDHDKLERTAIDLAGLVRAIRTANFTKEQAERFKVSGRKKSVVFGNQAALEELATILFDNALKYSPEGTPIDVRITEHRGLVRMTIHNQGEAIPEEKLAHLFDRFFRADTSRTHGDKSGYGLGLSIAQKIVDVHHGSIEVESTETGTTFTVSLPAFRRQQSKVESRASKPNA